MEQFTPDASRSVSVGANCLVASSPHCIVSNRFRVELAPKCRSLAWQSTPWESKANSEGVLVNSGVFKFGCSNNGGEW